MRCYSAILLGCCEHISSYTVACERWLTGRREAPQTELEGARVVRPALSDLLVDNVLSVFLFGNPNSTVTGDSSVAALQNGACCLCCSLRAWVWPSCRRDVQH